MVVWGYVMWWQRRPKRGPVTWFGAARVGSAPARGALNEAPWWGMAAVALGAIAIGLFLPLVGISLAVFVVIDVLLGVKARRRERLTVTS